MQTPNPIPIIDTHQHLWDFAVLRPPWLAGAGLPLERSYTPDDYRQASTGCGIVQSVYVEVGVAPDDRLTEAAYAAARCADPADPLCAIVAGGDFAAPDFADYLEELTAIAGPYLRGVRGPLPRTANDQTAWVQGAHLLGERGLHGELLAQPSDLWELSRLVQRCSGTRFILDHCGGINPWSSQRKINLWTADMMRLAENSNVALKVSGLINRAPADAVPPGTDRVEVLAKTLAPIVGSAGHVFDMVRVLWGSDWPVCNTTSTLNEWMQVTQHLFRLYSPGNQQAILHDNAQHWYRLPPATAPTPD